MSDSNKHRRRWLIQAPVGLVLIGFGVSLIAEAAHLKFSGAKTFTWFSAGTLALVVFNSGLSIFGGAIIHRIRYEWSKQKNN
jgi:cytochrome c oxidase assembly factor CtaG